MGGADRGAVREEERELSFFFFFFFFSFFGSFLNLDLSFKNKRNNQVSLGVHGSEEDAARAYDRALIMEKGEKKR